ncbi:MAG: molybdopterin-binding/glycosyltransferase family 2 protein [Geminicoccaceae bacterium]|nr:molybdopterin-binding/glycosyltransferase family 2 protein [Geminicoccaceae bacterium]
MQFGPRRLADARGALLAHSLRREGLNLKKGHRLTEQDLAVLREAGVDEVMAVVLDADDMHEDEAASLLANALSAAHLEARPAFTGRANLHTDVAGLLLIDEEAVDRINRVHEAITLGTLPAHAVVRPHQMVATVKIIPYAAPRPAVDRCLALAAEASVLRLAPFRPLRADLIQTELPSVAAKVLDKTARITAERMAAVGGALVSERRCAHTIEALTAAIATTRADLLLIAGASAIADRRDVLPAAIEAAGGTLHHFGMPVDPGNLLLLAEREGKPVLGLPGCARSPKLNGYDWVLQRLAAGVKVTGADIMGMGVGGLLAEIPTRPQPRGRPDRPDGRRLAAVVLAAGQSRRMGPRNKLLIEVDGKHMVAHAVEAAREAGLDPIVLVTGHQAAAVEAAAGGPGVRVVHNDAYADGLSTSLKAGVAALPDDIDGALICLGDMPRVDAALIRRLVAMFKPTEGRAIVVPTFAGKRGNPVLWSTELLAEMQGLEGDVGAKHLIGLHEEAVVEVESGDGAGLLDIDTPEALDAYRRSHGCQRSPG